MRTSIVLLFVTISSILFAQERTAKEYMGDMKNGVLLVRLPTHINKIEALNNNNQKVKAEEVAGEAKREQQRWIDAYKVHYSYSKVYFFYDYDSREIINGNSKGTIFDYNRQPIPDVNFSFLVATFGESENLSLDGIIILTPAMETVPDKVPNLIKKYSGFMNMHTRTEAEMVIELQKRFDKFKF